MVCCSLYNGLVCGPCCENITIYGFSDLKIIDMAYCFLKIKHVLLKNK